MTRSGGHQYVHVGRHEAAIRLLGFAHDRLTSDVEAGVDEHGAAGLFMSTSGRAQDLCLVFCLGVHVAQFADDAGLDARVAYAETDISHEAFVDGVFAALVHVGRVSDGYVVARAHDYVEARRAGDAGEGEGVAADVGVGDVHHGVSPGEPVFVYGRGGFGLVD